jgi:hypothetical protein
MKKHTAILTVLLMLVAPAAWAASAAMVAGASGYVEAGGDVTAPTLTSITIATNGTSWTFAYSENVTGSPTSDLCGAYTAAMTTAGAITLTYASGDGTSSVVCTGSPTVNSGDTVANGGVDYTQPGNGIEDAAGNDLASLTDKAVTNNSIQGACGTTKTYVASSYRSGFSAGSASTIATSSTVTVTAGNGLVAIVNSGYDSSRTVSGVTDGTNAYTYLYRSTTAGGDIEIWYHSNATGVANATTTATYSGAVQYRGIQTIQITGQLTSGMNDKYSAGGATSKNFTAGDVTTVCNDEILVFGASQWDVTYHTAAANWTLLTPNGASANDYCMLYRIVTGTGTYPSGNAATTTTDPAFQYISVLGTFK